MSALRRAELAGTWYPDDAETCLADFAAYARESVEAPRARLSGAVVPHAGWAFSGSIAFNALSELASHCEDGVDTLVMFAGHLRPGAAPTVMTRGDYWTPCGVIENDVELCERVAGAVAGIRVEDPTRHSQDNSTEVELPMLRHLFGEGAGAGATGGARRLCVVGAPPDGKAQALGRSVAQAARALG
ncbi:MAG: AmmeMemoRadiSam system protein B, partial [Myxococcales bacterium]|nr:AmmeMemoRadiSam system protein B [Myxococcales bacterium]